MLNFYHSKVLVKKGEIIHSRWYEYYRINEDNLSDIYQLLVKFDDFLCMFDRILSPSHSAPLVLDEIQEHQSKVFYKNGKSLLDFKNVDAALFFCSVIVSDIANLYPSLRECNLRLINSTLRGIFDEEYKEQTLKYYLNGNFKKGKRIEIDCLLDQLKETNSYQQLFYTAFIEAIVNSDSNQIVLSRRSNQDAIAKLSLKGVGSLLFDLLSSIHHRNIRDFRHVQISSGDPSDKKHLTYPLNILFGFICIEILSLVFSFLQNYINTKKIDNLAPLESPGSEVPTLI